MLQKVAEFHFELSKMENKLDEKEHGERSLMTDQWIEKIESRHQAEW